MYQTLTALCFKMAFQVDISLRYICCRVHSMCFSLPRRPIDWGQITKQSKLWIIERYDPSLSIYRGYYIGIKKAFFCLSTSANCLILLLLVTEELGSPNCWSSPLQMEIKDFLPYYLSVSVFITLSEIVPWAHAH